MARCGRHVGMAFQMVDDLLDVPPPEAALGKPIGLDVREGNPSLPIVLAAARTRRSGDSSAAPSCRRARSPPCSAACAGRRDPARLRPGRRTGRRSAPGAADAARVRLPGLPAHPRRPARRTPSLAHAAPAPAFTAPCAGPPATTAPDTRRPGRRAPAPPAHRRRALATHRGPCAPAATESRAPRAPSPSGRRGAGRP